LSDPDKQAGEIAMAAESNLPVGRNIHIVMLRCNSAEDATSCLHALSQYGRPNALEYGCESYEFGRKAGESETVILVERWPSFDLLDRLLTEKVIPALPTYNALLERAFDPLRDTIRLRLE
jgi:quinol monooxygenase YgiN